MQNKNATKISRDKFDYRQRFDITLATFYCVEQAELIPSPTFTALEDKLFLYENIERVLKGLGHKVFIPYRDIGGLWDTEKILGVVHEIVVPESKMIVCDSEIPSPVDPKKPSYFVEGIVETAHKFRIPVIHLKRRPPVQNRLPEQDPLTDYVVNHIVTRDALLGVEVAAKNYWRNAN